MMRKFVAVELWHPNQKGKFHKDGSYQLKVPYSKDTELVMDILMIQKSANDRLRPISALHSMEKQHKCKFRYRLLFDQNQSRNSATR